MGLSVLHLSVYPEQGQTYTKKSGVASYLKKLLTSTTVPVSMTVLCDKDGSGESYEEDGLIIVRGRRVGLLSIWDIVRYLRHSKHETIHVQHELHFWGSMLVGYLVLFLPLLFPKRKWILTSHHAIDYDTIDQDFIRNHGQKLPVWIVRLGFRVLYRLYCLWDTIIVHEQVHIKRLTKQYGLNIKKLSVIHHGVDDLQPLDRNDSKTQLNINHTNKTIFTMGYVTGYKDLSILIEGYALWLQDNPNSILIIGSGPEKKSLNNPEYMTYYKSLRDLAKQLIPEQNYRRLGFVSEEEIALYYSACDVIVLPYRYTLSASGPMAISFAYEKPFLASRCFEDYFSDFQQCIFDMDKASLSRSLTKFYQQQTQFDQRVSQVKQERLYSQCLEKTVTMYQGNEIL